MAIDLAQPQFWLAFITSVAMLTPLTSAALRRWAFALVNVGFLFLLLGSWTLLVLAAVLCVSVLARETSRAKGMTQKLLAAGAGAILLGLFVVHKRPDFAPMVRLGLLTPVLNAIGFSYVALRLVELLRAAFERRLGVSDFPSILSYLLPFHMLAAGPIQSYEDFVAQPSVPKALSFDEALGGASRIARGLFKKYVLAYLVMQLGSAGWKSHGIYYLAEMNLHYLWLFLDFSAYSDIAVGIGTLMGVATPENFNRPYIARNITDFWERWHISLSHWLRRNLFMPIQVALVRRNYSALGSASLAIGIAFFISGAWHGLTGPFILWGLSHATALIACHWYREVLKRRLGSQGLKRYNSNLLIRCTSTLITAEFVAGSLVLVGTQWHSAW